MVPSMPVETASGGKRVPATERVLEYILNEMDEGRLRPGDRVNAARISATLELSAAPVREALSGLAGRGVLDLLPDRGAVMRAITPGEVIQLWELITPIGAVGLRGAAKSIAAGADRGELEDAFAAIRNHPLGHPPLAFLLRLNEWHYAANRIGGNPFVTTALERLGVSYWDRYLNNLIDVHANIDGYLENYRRMHEAVTAGDAEGAAAILRHHADWSITLINNAASTLKAAGRRRRKKI